ncbi:hypothetical protein KFK09_024604 [Dendrobium nobile]|uniref:Uncharacterized protein n=1 Tax=Dendrobium nobile TaxID=94219 RepID=A0A8T3AD23_DENNO|nr:hypothetical protein KFK09_024604 [Dendrobium nobile]
MGGSKKKQKIRKKNKKGGMAKKRSANASNARKEKPTATPSQISFPSLGFQITKLN